MNADQLKAQAAKHAPTAGIVTAGVIAVGLMMPSAPSAPTIAPVITASSAPNQAATPAAPGIETRLVSCGARPIIRGNDASGAVQLGAGAKGCTILFAAVGVQHVCSVVGGTITKVTTSDLVVANVKGGALTYTCEVARGR